MNYFFKNKKVLVTGASGFVGRNMFNKMKKLDANVVGTYFSHKVEGLTYCDLTSYEQVDNLMENVDYVFMIAAKTYGAGTLKSNPASMVKDTVTMDGNILEAAYKYKVKKVSYISSSVVYQKSFNILSEDDLDWNKDPAKVYMGVGWVKRYVEKLCAFYSQLGLPIDIVRPTNIYGPYDKYKEDESHVVPALVKRAIDKQNPYIVWGDGHAVKDFIFVDDFIRDMLMIFKRDGYDTYNLCSGKLTTIKEVVDSILDSVYNWPECEPKIIYDITKPNSIPFKSINRNKFDSIFGKQQYTDLGWGLVKVIKWLKRELNEK